LKAVLAQLPEGSRVAIVRLRSLGDAVLTTPAIHLLKQARPDLQIGIVIEPRFAGVFEGNPDIAEILAPGILNLRRFRPELCLNLHGGPVSARLTALSGARFRAGFAHYANAWAYNLRIPSAQEVLGVDRRVHTAEHLTAAMFFLGVTQQEIPRARLFADATAASVAVHTLVNKGAYAVLHAGASHASKAWPVPMFRSTAQYLKRTHELTPVFVGGPGEDLTPFQVWPSLASAPLNDLKLLMQNAAVFVGNDSGPAHIAAAFGIPAIVLFGTSDPLTWAPWRTQGVTLSAGGPMHGISEDQVRVALDRLRVHAL
jgi:heptosyltransferase-3